MRKRIREIAISPALNGYIVKVGCQRLVFETSDRMVSELSNYLNDPEATEDEYIKNAVNPMEECPMVECPSPPASSPATQAESDTMLSNDLLPPVPHPSNAHTSQT